MSLVLASIHVYPIKSLGGFAVTEARLTDRGLEHDRRWMLVDAEGLFLSQRGVPAMARLHCAPYGEGFRVTDRLDGSTLDLPWRAAGGEERTARVWESTVPVIAADSAADRWFSARMGRTARLVYMPDAARRSADPAYAQALTSLSDDFPYLLISQASLDDLNARGSSSAHANEGAWAPIPMERFRPNLVIAGGSPFQEDGWRHITIGSAAFLLVKPCARCVITTTDQRTGERGKEPLRTLATYRSIGNKVMFGMNAVGNVEGTLRVGDLVAPFHP